MQMQRMLAVGRLAVVAALVAVAGCSEGEWDWFGLKQTAPKTKQTTKARRPVKSEPKVAEARSKPEPLADDEKSREVDEKVERYVRTMDTKYDPEYQNNDFSSKIRRQNDPGRAARVRQTAIRARTEPTLDAAAAQVPDHPEAEETESQGETLIARNDGSDPSHGPTDAPAQVVEREPVSETSSEARAEASEAKPSEPAAAKETENPAAENNSAPSESAMKPPVLSEVSVSASPTPVESEPVEQKPIEQKPVATPRQEPKPVEPKIVEAPPVEKSSEPKPVAKPPVEEKVAEPTLVKTEPLKTASKKPEPQAEVPTVIRNTTEAPANPPPKIEPAPVEKKIVEERKPKPPAVARRTTDTLFNPPPKIEPAPVEKKIAEERKPEAPTVARNATEPPSNPPSKIEPAPVEKKIVEERKSEPPPVESPTVKTVSETPPIRKKHAANTPSTALPPEPADTFNTKLKDQEELVARNPDDVEEQFKLRMMYLVEGQDDKALATSSSMNAETQDILLGQIRALMAARSSTSRDPAVWANVQLEALDKLRGLLRDKADLIVPRVELCKSIEGFGRYEPIEPAVFKAGGRNRVLLYIEVDNFHCDKTSSGKFRTLLSVRESLMNKGGEELWSAKDDNIEDLARQKRRDFYLTIGPLAIPKSLGPGEYVFKVEVEDVLGGKINSNVVRFKMVP